MSKKLFLLLALVIILSFNVVNAATREDVIGALNATYTVGSETYRLPQSAINKGVNFLYSREFTSAQYDKMLGVIGSAVSIAREAGTTDITKVSKEDLRRGLGLISQASAAANISLSEVTSSLYRNAGKDSETPSNNTSNVEYIEKDSSGNIIIRNESGEVAGIKDTSGEIHEISGEYSGEIIPYISGDVSDILSNMAGNDVETLINRNVIIAIVTIVIILIILFFIICLLFKSKMNKIAKYILVIIFVLLFLALLIAFGVALYYLEEIKMLYKIYYIFK